MKSGMIGHPRITEAEQMRANGESYDAIARALKLPRGQVERYFRAKAKEAKEPRKWQPPAPPNTVGLSSKETARAHADWVHASLRDAARPGSGGTIRDIASLSGQYTQAIRLMARLDGSLELTEAQVAKSPAFRVCLEAVLRGVGDDLDLMKRIDVELEKIIGLE